MENALMEARGDGWTDVDADIIPIIDFETLMLKNDEWELAAIDFHVSNVLEQWRFELKPQDQGVEDEYLCSVMWKYSSGVSRKIGSVIDKCDPDMLVFWTRYEGIFKRLQREILVNGK
jgi:hypothetical protein